MTHTLLTLSRGLAAVVLLITTAAGCDAGVECKAGEVRYVGRPPRELFSYERTCRKDCFAMPQESGCSEECGDVNVGAPIGMLVDERQLVIADLDSLGNARGLYYSFTFVDEADGDSPVGWSFLTEPRTYLSDQIDGTARFVMETSVADYIVDANGLPLPQTVSSEPQRAGPARLEVWEVTADRIAGRFFLGWQNNTGQAQGEVIGCFDLSVGASVDVGGISFRLLGP